MIGPEKLQCLHELFRGCYHQNDVLAMGSSVRPLFAKVFKAKIGNTLLQLLIGKFAIYKRCVDDTICIVDENVNMTHAHTHTHTQTHAAHIPQDPLEKEENHRIPYMIVCLSRRVDGSTYLSAHRRTTWNDQYIHFSEFV